MQNTTPTLDDLIEQDAAAELGNNAVPHDDWLAEGTSEGQLAVDVVETNDAFLIVAAIAGVAPEDIDVAINRDMVTLRGRRREQEYVETDQFLYRECYWGNFSRTVILPSDVETDAVTADLRNGILTVRLPKRTPQNETTVRVSVSDDA